MRLLCQCNYITCDLKLTGAGASGDAFNFMAVTVTRRKIHPRVGARRVSIENWFDEADAFDKVRPVEGRKQFHARDDVAHCYLCGGLPMMLKLNDLLNALILTLYFLLNPFNQQRNIRVLIA